MAASLKSYLTVVRAGISVLLTSTCANATDDQKDPNHPGSSPPSYLSGIDKNESENEAIEGQAVPPSSSGTPPQASLKILSEEELKALLKENLLTERKAKAERTKEAKALQATLREKLESEKKAKAAREKEAKAFKRKEKRINHELKRREAKVKALDDTPPRCS